MLKKIGRALTVLVMISMLAACIDLGLVRDYASAASELTAGKELIERWRISEQKLDEHTNVLGIKFPPRRVEIDQAGADKVAEELARVHNLLGEYFEAVSVLAADGLPDVSKQTGGLSDAIAKLDSKFGEKEQTAFKAVVGLLSLPLEAYRQKELAKLMSTQQANVETLLQILARTSGVIESDVKAEQHEVVSRYARVLGDEKDVVLRMLIRVRVADEQKSDYPATLTAIHKYQKAVASIQASHARIIQTLNSNEADTKATFAYLKRAYVQILDARSSVNKAFN